MPSLNSDEIVIFSIHGKYGGEVDDRRRQFDEGQAHSVREYFDIAGTIVSNHARGLVLDVYRVKMDIRPRVCDGSLWFAAWPHCAGPLSKVALQTVSRKELGKRLIFTVSMRGAQR